MTEPKVEFNADALTIAHDRKNLAAIDRAVADGRINEEAADYLRVLYGDGMHWFREVFYFLGRCLGAPKAPVMRYDYETDSAVSEPVLISDIHPLLPYIVNHRLDMDPMRNQFFTSGAGHKIVLNVSSIVTVIIGAEKNIDRALEKITGKYYSKYVSDVCDAVYDVIIKTNNDASARAVSEKVRAKLMEKYVSTPAEAALAVLGGGHEKIAADLVRALDMVKKPRMRLQDVWRVKCLFDLVPQARTFIERIQQMMPERILSVRDDFYNIENPRNYRDAKLVINIGTQKEVVPMEIICQVRTFFEFEKQTHVKYESVRGKNAAPGDNYAAAMHDAGTKKYNLLVCRCLDDLFERVGWNIAYSRGLNISLFEGFPKECTMHYPDKVVDTIMEKLDNAIENEVFYITHTPAPLTPAQTSEIFHFMARFILVAAMPYPRTDWQVPSDTMAGKLFNFVMKEVQRYYKK